MKTKGPAQQTKGQRDATLASVTSGKTASPKGQNLQPVHSGSTRAGSKQAGK